MTDVLRAAVRSPHASARPERECTTPWRPSSTPSSTWPNGAGSSIPRARSTAARNRRGISARWAWNSRRTSNGSGGGRWSPAATTSSESIRRSSCRGRCGWPPVTSRCSMTRWSSRLITHKRYRADHLIEAYEAKHGHPPPNGLADIRDPETGEPGQWTEPREFNMMLKTYLGPIETEEGLHYLRPETAQGIFINFANVVTTARRSRRSVSVRSARASATRSPRATSSSEPASSSRWRWSSSSSRRPRRNGTSTGSTPACSGTSTSASIRRICGLFDHPKEKLSHYSDRTVDIEYKFGFVGNPWGELEGVANRTDFDLATHAKHSGADLSFYDQVTDTRYTPYVIEPAAGLTRSFMAFLDRRLHRGRSPECQGRDGEADGASAGPAAGAGQGRGAATVAARRLESRRRATWPLNCGNAGTSISTTPAPSGGGTGARTRSVRLSA